MSGSSKKKLRKEEKMAAMTEKQRQAQKEAKSLKAYTTTFVIIMVLVLAIFVGTFLRSPVNGIINRNTHAVTIGTHELSVADFSYYFVDAINAYYYNLYSYYGSYASYFLGFSTGTSLNDQIYDSDTGETWAEYFMGEAASNAQTVLGLYDLAIREEHVMSEDEIAAMDEQISSLKETASNNSFSSVNAYLKAVYGNGCNAKTYENYTSVNALANSYYTKYSEDLQASYTEDDFTAYEEDKVGQYYSYSYLLYQLNAEDYLGEGTEDEDGNVTYTEEEEAAALAAAKKDADILMNAGIADEKTFNTALLLLQQAQEKTDAVDEPEEAEEPEETEEPAQTEEPTAEATVATEETEQTGSTDATEAEEEEKDEEEAPACTVAEDKLFSSLDSTLQEWVTGDSFVSGQIACVEIQEEASHTHEEGEEHSDDEEVEYETTGYYVILVTDVNQNDMSILDVRHILIEVEELDDDASEDELTAANEAAKETAETILQQWKDGEATAESFGALAEEHSADTGSNTNGGLYEDVCPGDMVTAFNDWCFAEGREVGDTGIVETDYGYHIIYISDHGDYSYRNYMIMNNMLAEDLEAYTEDIQAATAYKEIDLSRMNWDITFGS